MSDQIKKIRSGVFERAFSVAKVSLKGTLKAGIYRIGSIGKDDDSRAAGFKRHLFEQAKALTLELSQLKGSFMKAGQMLSLYGEQFLPPEVNEVLKTLQSQSMPLAWDAVHSVLLSELGQERLAKLTINENALGSASLGQVHQATINATGEKLALKIQYPGVEKAIDSDLRLIKRLLKAGNWIPFSPALDSVFEEVRKLLHQEVDYTQEFKLTEDYGRQLANDRRFVVPRTVAAFSSPKVLATSYESGVPVDSDAVLMLSQSRRNQLGLNFFSLYLSEIFEFGQVQTDPHFGNYRVRLSSDGQSDQIICLDFGAVRSFEASFLKKFRQLLKATFSEDPKVMKSALENLGLVQPQDSEEWSEKLIALCLLMTEPARSREAYDWGQSDIAGRAFRQGRSFMMGGTVRLPPPEMFSLDRKSAGVFVLLSKWKVQIAVRPLIEAYFD